MAKTVYTPEEVELQDGTKVILKPLVIGRLKQAMAYVEDPGVTGDEELDGLDFLLGLVAICLKDQVGEDFDYEAAVDTPTAKRVVLVGTGIDFDDQNLMIAAAAAAAQSGQN